MSELGGLGLLIVAVWTAVFGAGFFWCAGKRLFVSIWGPEPPATQVVMNNHPPPGHYVMSSVEGFSILPVEAPAEQTTNPLERHREEVLSILTNTGSQVTAIKRLRELSGIGLKEAVEAVRGWARAAAPERPEEGA